MSNTATKYLYQNYQSLRHIPLKTNRYPLVRCRLPIMSNMFTGSFANTPVWTQCKHGLWRASNVTGVHSPVYLGTLDVFSRQTVLHKFLLNFRYGARDGVTIYLLFYMQNLFQASLSKNRFYTCMILYLFIRNVL